MNFKIEQIAICPPDPEKALKLLSEMGADKWVDDIVVAQGSVRGEKGLANVAHLSFNYDLLAPDEGGEFEILHYMAGKNWMAGNFRVSHLGVHCNKDELRQWKTFFSNRQIPIVQEVKTLSHNNPAITGKRTYHYCIFGTWEVLGVDLKFIVRQPA